VDSLGKVLVVAGLALAAVGVLVWFGFGKGRGGLLPGDISIERGEFRFYIPLVSCLVVSVVLTFIVWLFRR
jgi:hypothetical protein